MKPNVKKLLICLAIPLAIGGLASLLVGGYQDFQQVVQPPLSPPGWVFPVVWSILYLLMGYASYRVLTSGKEPELVRKALIAYGVQLALNFLWPLFFFGANWYLAAFVLLIGRWAAIYITMRKFSQLDQVAGDLLLPYILWVCFAGYLNLGVYLLN